MENEIWKDIMGYEGLYQISNLGRVKSLARTSIGYHYWSKKKTIRNVYEKILYQGTVSIGYLAVSLNKDAISKQFSVHRLMAIHFIPNPENKPEVNHINGIKNDNRLENLEWATHAENMEHSRLVLGKDPMKTYSANHKNEKHHNNKKVVAIDENGNILNEYYSATKASVDLGLSPSYVSQCIFKNKPFRNITFKYV